MVMGDLLVHNDGRAGEAVIHAANKQTGDRVGTVELPANGQYGMMTYLHEDKQYVVVQIGGSQYPSGLVALALP
jgi:quinoprotein glucose dehydrogenase